MKYRNAKTEDISDILGLQAQNYIGNLVVEERREGFLSVEFDREQLIEISEDIGILVAVHQDRLAGYMCALSREFSARFQLLSAMMAFGDSVSHRGRLLSSFRYFVYGPVCIDREYRGKGLLRGLYDSLLTLVAGRYDMGTTFVSQDNPHSVSAHVGGLGMKPLGEFSFEGRRHLFLVFEVAVRT